MRSQKKFYPVKCLGNNDDFIFSSPVRSQVCYSFSFNKKLVEVVAGAAVEVEADVLVDVNERQLIVMMEKIVILNMAATKSGNAQEAVAHGAEDEVEVVEDHLEVWVCFHLIWKILMYAKYYLTFFDFLHFKVFLKIISIQNVTAIIFIFLH